MRPAVGRAWEADWRVPGTTGISAGEIQPSREAYSVIGQVHTQASINKHKQHSLPDLEDAGDPQNEEPLFTSCISVFDNLFIIKYNKYPLLGNTGECKGRGTHFQLLQCKEENPLC